MQVKEPLTGPIILAWHKDRRLVNSKCKLSNNKQKTINKDTI